MLESQTLSSGSHDPLLSTLCSICHVKSHNYCCPRCSTLTCSLQCVQKHKKWADCNGKRNKAAYVPASQLATPAGIDRDYNYITSIEREIDKSEKWAGNNGIDLDGDISRRKVLARGQLNLSIAIQKTGAVVVGAPKGLSRSRTNATHWLRGSKCIEWTVEWIHPNGEKALGMCREHEPISKVYNALTNVKMHNRSKRKQARGDTEPASKKLDNHLHESKDLASTNAPNASTAAGAEAQERSAEKTETGPNSDPLTLSGDPSIKVDNPTDDQNQDDPKNLYFYIHVPSLPCRQKVVSPLPSGAKLSECLRDRVLLEYPTILVFERRVEDDPPDDIMTEDDFYKTARKEVIQELEDGELSDIKQETAEGKAGTIDGFDGGKVLEMLQKDVKAAQS